MFKIYGLMLNKFEARLWERVILKITFSLCVLQLTSLFYHRVGLNYLGLWVCNTEQVGGANPD